MDKVGGNLGGQRCLKSSHQGSLGVLGQASDLVDERFTSREGSGGGADAFEVSEEAEGGAFGGALEGQVLQEEGRAVLVGALVLAAGGDGEADGGCLCFCIVVVVVVVVVCVSVCE